MKKILEGYGYGIIQDCSGLLKTLKNKGFSKDEFLDFVEENRNKETVVLEKEFEELKKKNPLPNKTPATKFLLPGDLVLMEGVVCSKCGSEVYITAVCCGNILKAQGFLRKTICSSCGLETGQK